MTILDAPLDAPLDGGAAITTVTGAPYEYEAALAADAVADLIEILRKPRTSGLLEESVRPLQDTETAIWELLAKLLDLDNAGGVHLDRIGVWLDIARRDGWNDATYRARLRARILQHNSDGRVEDLVGIALLILAVSGTGQIRIVEHIGPACMDAYVTKVLDAADAEDLRVALGVSKAAGVSLQLLYPQTADAHVWGDEGGAVTGGMTADEVADIDQPAGVGQEAEAHVTGP